MSNKDQIYIEELEEENELLRRQLAGYHEVIEKVWTNSPTLGLVPEIDFYPVKDNQYLLAGVIIKSQTMKFKSLKVLREYIISQKVNHRVYIYLSDCDKIYLENTNSQGPEQEPQTSYIIKFKLGRKDGTDISRVTGKQNI